MDFFTSSMVTIIFFFSSDFDALISTLQTDSNQLIEWFKIKQANPEKIQNFDLTCESTVKLLGIDS
jgi:hypothetical protein